MARGRTTAEASTEECCAKCESDIAALRKEIAGLKRELAKKPAGGADPRVDKIVEYLQKRLQDRPADMTRKEYSQSLAKLISEL